MDPTALLVIAHVSPNPPLCDGALPSQPIPKAGDPSCWQCRKVDPVRDSPLIFLVQLGCMSATSACSLQEAAGGCLHGPAHGPCIQIFASSGEWWDGAARGVYIYGLHY